MREGGGERGREREREEGRESDMQVCVREKDLKGESVYFSNSSAENESEIFNCVPIKCFLQEKK
jgi:hypothetical protein